eukprot:TRINITY_DN13117_c0_g1_i1.p1 TRINITY_DN13117_c0_g1~~TRINITY_DN13117_c0_g1_i1.p1  ORF type:complete len:362 (+),score=65.51 TRINITY_DN13117_c0_g1_i1:47-1132(+)
MVRVGRRVLFLFLVCGILTLNVVKKYFMNPQRSQIDPSDQNGPFSRDLKKEIESSSWMGLNATNPKNPQRFLIYDGFFGKYNNQYISLILAILIARKLDRQVVFPGWIDRYYALDREYRSDPLPFAAYLDPTYARRGHLPIIDREVYYRTIYPHIPLNQRKRLKLPRYVPGEGLSVDDVLQIMQKSQERHLDVGIIFHWKFHSLKSHRYLYPYLRPNPDIRKLAEDWIDQNMERPYLGLHFRKSEGFCKQTVHDVIKKVGNLNATTPYKSVFLASDHQDLKEEAILCDAIHPKMFTNTTHGVYTPGIIDSYILGKADYLLVNRYSTLSFNSVRARIFWHNRTDNVNYLMPIPPKNSKLPLC